jgi:hypothetical protein
VHAGVERTRTLADARAPGGLQVDQIYHLACPASPVHYQYNPVKTIKARLWHGSPWLALLRAG